MNILFLSFSFFFKKSGKKKFTSFEKGSFYLKNLEVKVKFCQSYNRRLSIHRELKNICQISRRSSLERKARVIFRIVDELGLSSKPPREAPTEPQPIKKEFMYYRGDGKILAAKIFSLPAQLKKMTKLGENPANKKRKHDEVIDSAWLTAIRRKFDLMKENPHVRMHEVCPVTSRR